MSARTLETQAVQYELEVSIDATPEQVWSALTASTDAWWLADFRMCGEGSRVTLEARAGGQLVEQRDDGSSLLWYTVQMCTPGEALHLVGHLGPDWGGPATSMMKVALAAAGDGTLLKIQDALFGALSESAANSLESGWRQLFEDGLKAYVEG